MVFFLACKTCKSPENICLECFSKGKEFQKHKKTHRYAIIQEKFSVLEPKWTASEEIILLDSLIQKGIYPFKNQIKKIVKT